MRVLALLLAGLGLVSAGLLIARSGDGAEGYSEDRQPPAAAPGSWQGTIAPSRASRVRLRPAAAGPAAIAAGRRVESDPALEILERIGSPRVLTLDLVGDTAMVTGRTPARGGEQARTRWYQTIAGAAYSQKVGATRLSRRVLSATGALIEESEDAVHTVTSDRDWFGPVIWSAPDIAREVGSRAPTVGARVLHTNHIPLFGGIAEIVLQVDDEVEFMAESGQRLAIILGELSRNNRPYLVTVVDSGLEPRLVLGFTPSVGGTIGNGIGWQASGVDSNSIYGAVEIP